MTDYARKLVRRYLRRTIGMSKPALFLAHDAMNAATAENRGRFWLR